MFHLTGMICRICKCAIGDAGERARPVERENPGGAPEAVSSDDLTRIRGIGIATEDRLYRAGIKSYDQLAGATPEELQKILGKPRADISYEAWVARARDLSGKT